MGPKRSQAGGATRGGPTTRRRMTRGCRGAARGRARTPSRPASGRRWSASGTQAPTPPQREQHVPTVILCLAASGGVRHNRPGSVRVCAELFFVSCHIRTACTRAGCRAYNREREAAAQRRRAAEADAYARSRKILEEELARDRAWRDAVKQVRTAGQESQLEYHCSKSLSHWDPFTPTGE